MMAFVFDPALPLMVVVALAVAVASLTISMVDASPVLASAPVDSPVTTEIPPRPPTTANDFLPDERDVTDCIGVLERPGCGSEERGGWHQTLVLVAIFGGLAIVFANVVRGVRQRTKT